MNREMILAMDGPALVRLAWELGLAPEDVQWPPGCAYAYDAEEHAWRPWSRLAQADAVFRQLRTRGWTTACTWFGDDRQYGEAWVGCAGARAYSVRWPTDAVRESMALLLVSVLAVVGEARTTNSAQLSTGLVQETP